jgi:hypothetical protein
MTFVQDEKRVSKLVELIDLEQEGKDEEIKELELTLLRKAMSKLAKHPRRDLTTSEETLLEMDAADYNRIVHSK